MEDFRIVVKSFILNKDNELLLVKRKDNDPILPGAYEIPGGTLNLGEDPFLGLKRETKEETNLDIEISNPLTVRQNVKADGKKFMIISFLCRPLTNKLILSEEHTEFVWLSLKDGYSKIHEVFHKDIDNIEKYFLKKKD
jgi:8-oxo-dGTP diphosphatase